MAPPPSLPPPPRPSVVADVQPSFVPTDARFVFERIDAAIHASSYAWRTMMAAGVHVAGGSDAPVEPPEPLLGIYDAMVRTARPDGPGLGARARSGPGSDALVFRPEERLPFAAALGMYTLEGAYACARDRGEGRLGSLEVGADADFVVLDTDVSRVAVGGSGVEGGDATTDVDLLLQAAVLATYVGGVKCYDKAEAEAESAVAATEAAGTDATAAVPPPLPVDPLAPGRNGPLGGGPRRRAWGCRCCLGQGGAIRNLFMPR